MSIELTLKSNLDALVAQGKVVKERETSYVFKNKNGEDVVYFDEMDDAYFVSSPILKFGMTYRNMSAALAEAFSMYQTLG
jgi:hypothetical protein